LKRDIYWDILDDLSKLRLFQDWEAIEKSYSYLTIPFKQLLSYATQITRHNLKDQNNKYPSILYLKMKQRIELMQAMKVETMKSINLLNRHWEY